MPPKSTITFRSRHWQITTASALTPKDHYRHIYFDTLDMIMGCIRNRFDQRGYKIYANLEAILLKGVKGEDYEVNLTAVKDLYGEEDFNTEKLNIQLQIMASSFSGDATLPNILEYLKAMGKQQELVSEVAKLCRLILLAPATNATCERSFSALKRVKTYLRSTMKQDRLNNIMVLHIHKDYCDELDSEVCIKQFCFDSDHRKNIFGRF